MDEPKELDLHASKKGCSAYGHKRNCDCGYGITGGEERANVDFVQKWHDKARANKQEWEEYLGFCRDIDPAWRLTPRQRLSYFEEMEAV